MYPGNLFLLCAGRELHGRGDTHAVAAQELNLVREKPTLYTPHHKNYILEKKEENLSTRESFWLNLAIRLHF